MPTYKSLPRYSNKRIERMRNGLLRSWQPGGAHHKRFRERPVDADTVRKRALWDRKGKGVEFPRGLQILHSKRRSDSYDVLIDGGCVLSGGRVKVGQYLASLLP